MQRKIFVNFLFTFVKKYYIFLLSASIMSNIYKYEVNNSITNLERLGVKNVT